jgi:glycosyltransferase involved in cell wall biosynthesis
LHSLAVSVVIPAYNRPEMTARAVHSALGQRPHPPAEVVVVDDCSSDDTGAVAAAAGARVIRHEVNRGEGAARNTAIQEAREPWVALLDSDDEWLPNHLAVLWPHHEGRVVLGSTAVASGSDAEFLWGRNRDSVQVLASPADLLRGGNALVASSVVVRRDAVLKAGGFREDLKRGADLDLWLRVLEAGPGLVSPEVTVRYHLHDAQVSTDRSAMWDAHRAIVDAYRDRPWCTPTVRADVEAVLRWDELRAALREGDRATAARCAAGLAIDPRKLASLARALVGRRALRGRTRRYLEHSA